MHKLLVFLFTQTIFLLSFAQAPTAQFNATPVSICLGESVSFTNTSTIGTTPIVSYNWNFGDGNSATTQNATHTFTSTGSFTITLVVTDQNNLADSEVKINYITVTPNPVNQFTVSNNGCTLPANVTFTNQSSVGANFSYSWNFGNTQTSILQNPPSISYSTVGTYNVNLVVTNTTTGCQTSTTTPVTISSYSCDFTSQDSVCAGSTINLTDNSTTGVNSWNWNNGNGVNSNIQNPSFTYNTPGTYTISLTSQNTNLGCTGNSTKQIVVVPLPNPTFTANPTSGCAPLNVNFSNTSSSGSNFQWDFGDGTTFNGSTPPSHTYTTNGNFTVSLTSTGIFGCSNTTIQSNLIQTTPPLADFSSPIVNGCSPALINFIDNSATTDPIVNWLWDFGDGSTFNGQNPPAHSYNSGQYNISLTITTQGGCSNTVTKPNYIQIGFIDLVNFSYSPSIECAKTPITFTDLSVISTPHLPSEVTYNWGFSDGGSATSQNTTYSFPTDTGYFDAQLIVTFRGCRDTLTIDSAIYIKAPISLFTAAQNLYCNLPLPVTVSVNDNSIIGNLTDSVKMIWRWDDALQTDSILENNSLDINGNGNSSFTYNSYGTYTVKQVIYNYTTGCSDSTTQIINISETIADFTLSNDSVCKNSIATLTSTSSSSHPFGTFSYNMGNGQTTSGNPATYAYPLAGIYNITLTATNTVGCAASKIFTGINILELPVASFTPSSLTGCAPINITYTNTSHPQGNGYPGLLNYNWTFPNNSTQITTDINTTTNYTINTQGTFTTRLTVTDSFGCISPIGNNAVNITIPTPNFTIDSVLCNNVLVNGINTTTGTNPLSYEWNLDNINILNSTNFSNTFNDNILGIYQIHKVTLIATDGNGCIDSISKNVKITSPKPFETHIYSGANLNNNNTASCPPIIGDYKDSSSYYGSSLTYYWSFGNGNHSTIANPQNIYVYPGNYTVSLLVTDQFGCKDSISNNSLTINGPTTSPNITSNVSICKNEFIFDTLNSVDVHHLLWEFGDGSNTTTLAASHNYIVQGNYQTTLHVYDTNNCEIIYLDTIQVFNNQITANFTPSFTTAEMGTNILFTDSSIYNSPIQSWAWNFGDQNNTEQINSSNSTTSFIYDLPNTYQITLIITDQNGCVDTTYKTVIIIGSVEFPTAFTPDNDSKNDYWEIRNIDKLYPENIVKIFNRWGNLVYESEKGAYANKPWNGKLNDENLPIGSYYFVIEYNSSKKSDKGTVTIIR